jgi:hypothetical protein
VLPPIGCVPPNRCRAHTSTPQIVVDLVTQSAEVFIRPRRFTQLDDRLDEIRRELQRNLT